jgi:hypothetical protein
MEMLQARVIGLVVGLSLVTACRAESGRLTGNPLAHLPDNIELLTRFGERADISPDNRRIAFMDKTFGNAFVIDLTKRDIRCLTCHIPGAAFLRVMHLVTGDYLIIGPARFTDARTSRYRESEMWFLSQQPDATPVPLGTRLFEGAAVSKTSLTIGWAETAEQNPDLHPQASRLLVAQVRLSGGTAALVAKRVVHESRDASCVIEAQDFYDNDVRMTFTCYEPAGKASVMGLDLRTGTVVNFSKAPGTYNEAEGIFPDGHYTCVESDRQVGTLGGPGGSQQIDIWKLRLDETGKDVERLTHFNDYKGWKASNPVVSTDGRFMAFQVARVGDEPGAGRGILLYRFGAVREERKALEQALDG